MRYLRFRTLLQNKHTTYAGVAFISINFLTILGSIWFPAYKEQFESTASLLEDCAIAYGLVMAGDSKATTTLQHEIPNSPGTSVEYRVRDPQGPTT